MGALFPDEESPCNRRKLFRFCKIACLLLCPPTNLNGWHRIFNVCDPPPVWWTPMLGFRARRTVSDECDAPDISRRVQARGSRSGRQQRPVGREGRHRAGFARDGVAAMGEAVLAAGDGDGEAPHNASTGPV